MSIYLYFEKYNTMFAYSKLFDTSESFKPQMFELESFQQPDVSYVSARLHGE